MAVERRSRRHGKYDDKILANLPGAPIGADTRTASGDRRRLGLTMTFILAPIGPKTE